MSELLPPEVGADEARDVADQVLSGRAYVEAARPPSLQERLFDWIGDRIGDLFEALSTSGGRGLGAWLIIGLFAALIVFLLSRLLRNVGPLPVRAAPQKPVIDILDGRTAAEWLAAAHEAEAATEWRSAVRCRHRALVARLISQGVVTARPGLTAGEINRMVAERQPGVAPAMQEATLLFKDTWYGWVDASAESSSRFAELSDQVLAAELVTP